jgi:hypothetical protein
VIARPADLSRPALVALGSLAALWVWALLSTTWAESADQALTEANRWLIYVSLFAVLVLLLRDDFLGRLVIYAATAAISAFALYVAVRLVAGGAGDMFLLGRLNRPLGYVNGEAGYLLAGLWPLVALAERRRGALSALAVTGATLVMGVLLLCQSRAVLPALAVSMLFFLAFVPGRLRRAWILVFVAAGVLAAAGPLLDVYEVTRGLDRPPPDETLRTAGTAILLCALAAGVLWLAADRLAAGWAGRLDRRRAQALAAVPLVAVVVVAAVAGVTATGDPVGKVRAEYHDFVSLRTGGEGSSRFSTGGGYRYDYWRVAWHEFTDRPLQGQGGGNYDAGYFRERRTTQDIRQPHSLPIQLLAELGLVGLGLLMLFLVALGFGLARRVRASGRDADERFLVVGAAGITIVWLVHTTVDWLHLIPGVTGFALAAGAVLVGPWRRPGERARHSGPLRRAAVLGAALLTLVGALTLGRYVLAERYRTSGQEALASDPERALARADDSLALNGESLPAYYLRAAALARAGRYQPARNALGEAIRREPHDFVPWALRGDLAARRGDLARARRDYRRAAELNPRDRGLRRLAARPPG